VRMRVVEANPPRSRDFVAAFSLGRPPERGYGLPALEQIGYGTGVRLFVAAVPPPALARQLADAAAELATPELRPTPPENVHVTIHFLGEVDPDAVPALRTALADACVHHAPAELTVDAIAPGPPRRPRMLWGTARATPAYEALVNAVAAAAAPHAPDARRARPGTAHLTLARLRGRAELRDWPEPRPLTDALITVSELALVESELGPDGPRYTTLATLPLAGGQPAGRR
jgi:2'-5' RNA ligase